MIKEKKAAGRLSFFLLRFFFFWMKLENVGQGLSKKEQKKEKIFAKVSLLRETFFVFAGGYRGAHRRKEEPD